MGSYFKSFEEFNSQLKEWKDKGLKIVFTNGCFDLLHRGHVEYIAKAKSFGDILIIGLNSDKSVKKLKGEFRPFIDQNDRGYILSQLKPVDAVVVFNEETPFSIINQIIPDVLVKGGDYKIDEIVGRETVEKNGGVVKTVKYIQNNSTSLLIEKIKQTN